MRIINIGIARTPLYKSQGNNGYFKAFSNAAIATITELYALCIFAPYHFIRGKKNPVDYKGLNPSQLDSTSVLKPALIFFHGDKGDPSTIYPWVDKVTTGEWNVFAPKIPYNDKKPESHEKFVRHFFKHIKRLYKAKDQTPLIHVVAHSKGGMQGVKCLIAQEEHAHPINGIRIIQVITIGSRLIPFKNKGHPSLQKDLKLVATALQKKPQMPIRAIVPRHDWVVPNESSAVGRNIHYIEDRGHLGALYANQTHRIMLKYLRQPLPRN